MWGIIVQGITSLATGYFETKREKQKAEAAYHMALAKGEQDWDLEAQKAARYSWKDELITIIWYSPLIIGWYNNTGETWTLRSAEEWIQFVSELPYWWQFGAFGIMAASFGLRWYFKDQNFKVKGS